MNFADLHELLRLELLRRIDSGRLTGARLAQLTGFRQAHISNFLNRRRSLSLEGLDRVLKSQNLTIDQLLPIDLASRAALLGPDPVEFVPVVSPTTAMAQAQITSSAIIESLHLPAGRLDASRSRTSAHRAEWQRFVAVRVDAQQAAAMSPVLSRGTVVVIDRHYTSLAPLRGSQPNVYAIRSGPSLLMRYVDLDDANLVLRPCSLDHPVQILPAASPFLGVDALVGRICFQLAEL